MVHSRQRQQRRLEKLREYFHDLEALRLETLEGYLRDREKRYAAERLLFLIAEAVLDFLDHELSSRFDTVSDSYEEILVNAFKKGLLPEDLYGKLKGLGGFRNILAHAYLELDDREVFENYRKMLALKEEVLEAFGEMFG